jgi:RNA-directed DNA polymerase
MRMEQRETRRVARFQLYADACTDGQFKGYTGLERINSAAKDRPEEKMTHLMHHLNLHNLRQAFCELDGSKASGVDQVTKLEYGKELEDNIYNLCDEIQRGGWRPKPSREVLIPKPTGGTRPLAVGCLEDKIVQTACTKVLEAIFEPEFHRHSYGFRYKRNTHQAIAQLYQQIKYRAEDCVVVEMDIEKFFNTIDHDKLMAVIEERIKDQHFLRLLKRQLRNSILSVDGEIKVNEIGTPQGSPISPVLANIFLNSVLDQWFSEHWSERGEIVRYADDAVFVFGSEGDATQFQKALIERLSEAGGLNLNLNKSGIIRFSKRAPEGDIPFLGFVLYWGKSGSKQKLLKVKTAPKRVAQCIQRFKEWIKTVRHRYTTKKLWQLAASKLRGHYNYYGVSHNGQKLQYFYHNCIMLLFKWLNRRSQKRSWTWFGFKTRLKFNPLPKPPIVAELINVQNGLGSELKHKPKSRMRKLRKSGSARSRGTQVPLFT